MSFSNLIKSFNLEEKIEKERQEIIDKIANLESEIKNFRTKLIALDQFISATRIITAEKSSIFTPSVKEIAEDNKKEKILVKEEVKKDEEMKIRKRRKLTLPKEGTWTGSILEILKRENRGLTNTELKTLIKETSLGGKLNKTEKSFYGAIDKLSSRFLINKHNGKLYSLEAFAIFKKNVEDGIEQDSDIQGGRGKPSALGGAIKEFLQAHNDQSNTKEIRDYMIKDERFRSTIEKHHSFLYNVIANLQKKKEIIKEGRNIILVK